MGDSKSAKDRGSSSKSGRSGGKMPNQSKGNVTMRDFERGKQIRDLSENRLKSDLSDLDNQEMSSILSIRRDQRKLKEKLFNVQKSSGHYNKDRRSNSLEIRKPSAKVLEKSIHSTNAGFVRDSKRLPSLGENKDGYETTPKENSNMSSNVHLSTDPTLLEEPSLKSKSLPQTVPDSRQSQALDSLSLPVMRERSKSEQNLNAAWYSNLDEVRSVINQRLSTSMNNLSGKKEDDEKDLAPFLFAVPDGLPRTMYLLPSLDERFHQATRARYIRKPGTKLDPIDRELNLNEIFGKTKSEKSD